MRDPRFPLGLGEVDVGEVQAAEYAVGPDDRRDHRGTAMDHCSILSAMGEKGHVGDAAESVRR